MLFILIILGVSVLAYKMEPGNDDETDKVVHQHITKEAENIWHLIPSEIKNK